MLFFLLAVLGLGVGTLSIGDESVEADDRESDLDGSTDEQLQQPDTAPLTDLFAEEPPAGPSEDQEEETLDPSSAETITVRHGEIFQAGPEDNVIHSSFGGVAHGGEGADTISARHGGIAHGEAGNDLMEVSGGSTVHGGDGDDTIVAEIGEGGANVISGGEGSDTFAFVTSDTWNEQLDQTTVIQDFNVEQDVLVLSTDIETSAIRSFEVRPTEDGSTELVLELGGNLQHEGGIVVHTIRLDGVTDFQEVDIMTTSDPMGITDEHQTGSYLHLQPTHTVAGSDAADNVTISNDGMVNFLNAQGGDDTVTSDAGDVIATLGSGNDSFHGQAGMLSIDGASGNDTLVAGANTTARLDGGTGDDNLTAANDYTSDELFGGDGNDTLTGCIGDQLHAGAGTNTIVLNIDGEHIGNDYAEISGLGSNHAALAGEAAEVSDSQLVLNISKELEEDLLFIDVTLGAGHSEVVVGTKIFLGETQVAFIHEYDDWDGVGWRIDDPRLAVNWV